MVASSNATFGSLFGGGGSGGKSGGGEPSKKIVKIIHINEGGSHGHSGGGGHGHSSGGHGGGHGGPAPNLNLYIAGKLHFLCIFWAILGFSSVF